MGKIARIETVWEVFAIVGRGVEVVDCGPDVTILDAHGISSQFLIGIGHNSVPLSILSAEGGLLIWTHGGVFN